MCLQHPSLSLSLERFADALSLSLSLCACGIPLSLSLSLSLFLALSIYISIVIYIVCLRHPALSLSLALCPSVCLPIHPSTRPSIHTCACGMPLSLSPSLSLVPRSLHPFFQSSLAQTRRTISRSLRLRPLLPCAMSSLEHLTREEDYALQCPAGIA